MIRTGAVEAARGVWCWHLHDTALAEPLTGPFETRLDSLRPEHERELRLRLIAPVHGEIPAALREAWVATQQAWATSDPAYAQMWDAFDQAWTNAQPAMEALHAVECSAYPWNGKTIFPDRNRE